MLTLGSGSWLHTKERKGANSWASPQMAGPFLTEYELAYQLTPRPRPTPINCFKTVS